MKILHVSGAKIWGGNEQQLVDLMPELNKLRVENLVFGIKNSPLYQFIKKTNYSFLIAEKDNVKSSFKQLKKIVEQENVDLIHLHTSDSVTCYVLAAILLKLRTPAILSKKGIGNSMSWLSIYKYNYTGIKRIICVSKAVRKDLKEKVIKKKNWHKLEVVYDGVNLDRTKVVRQEDISSLFNISKDVKILGNIANHSQAKDLGVLLKMMHHLVYGLMVKDVHLLQIGSFSKLSEELKHQVTELELEEHVTFGGFQSNALDFLPQFDIYVMSSQREGLPITIFEAFYKRTPVVSTRAGGIPEAIEDGENGFLADVKDYKVLAEKAALLLKEPDLQNEFIEKSELIFHNRFRANITALGTLNIYNKVLEK